MVVIPCYNAARTLPTLLGRLTPMFARDQIVCVDDGSTDDTQRVISEFGVCGVYHAVNQGKGQSLRDGYEFSLSRGASTALTIDSDLQHSPDDIPRFLEASQDVDLLIGSRRQPNAFFNSQMPLARQVSNRLTSSMLSCLLRQPILDSQCGFRLVSRRCLETVLPLCRERRYMFETEFLIHAATRGFAIGFVNIATIYNGEKSYINALPETLNFLKLVLRKIV